MKRSSPVPIWAILATLAAFAMALYLVLPNRSGVLERLVRDGKVARAYKVWKDVPPEEIALDPIRHQLLGLQLRRQLAPKNNKDQTRALLQEASDGYLDRAGHAGFFDEIILLIPLLAEPEEALQLLEPVFEKLNPDHRGPLLQTMVKNALEWGQPEVAAKIYARFWSNLPHTEPNLAEFVRLWRLADEPEKALGVLQQFEKAEAPDLFAFSRELGRRRIDLLRELGLNEEAFDRLYTVTVRATNQLERTDLEVLQATASNIIQQKKLVELYHLYLKHHPDDLSLWQDMAEMAGYADDFASAQLAYQKIIAVRPDDLTAVRALAQLSEWTGQARKAFDLYLVMAKRGDETALDRLVELNPGLYRDGDLLDVLSGWKGEGKDGRHVLLLARMLTKHGDYAAAEKQYQTYLAAHPTDRQGLEEYGAMLKRQFAFKKALGVFSELSQAMPQEIGPKKTVAELHYLLGDFDKSFACYREIVNSTNDYEALQHYANLGEALGLFDAVTTALSRQLELSTQRTESDYLKLAYVCDMAGDEPQRRRCLQRGLKEFSKSDVLRLQLAMQIAEQKDRAQAIEVLQGLIGLKTNLPAASLYLNLLVEQRDFTTAKAFAGALPAGLRDVPQVALLCALIEEGTGDEAAAEKTYRQLHEQNPEVPSYALNYASLLTRRQRFAQAEAVMRKLLRQPTPPILGEAARLYTEMGDFKRAEQLQRRFLESTSDATFQDWSYLGDICAAAGAQPRAREAYERALTVFHAKSQAQ